MIVIQNLFKLLYFFPQFSWLLSVNLGWEGGVHVQTCGHHLHLDCLKSYRASLRGQQRQQNIAVDRGEYFCPLCRQLANSVLPLSPQLGECAAVVKSRHASTSTVLSELNGFLKEIQRNPVRVEFFSLFFLFLSFVLVDFYENIMFRRFHRICPWRWANPWKR